MDDELILFDSVPKTKAKRFAQAVKKLQGLNAYWPLNEVSGDALNQAPLTKGGMNGFVDGPAQGMPGRIGKCYSFDGVNDSIFVADDSRLETPQITVFALVNARVFSGLSHESNILSKEFFNTGYVLRCGTGKLAFAVGNNSAFVEAGDPVATMKVNRWFLCAGTFDGAVIRVYVNGSLRAQANQTALVGNVDVFSIGQESGQGRFINANIQHVGVVSRALTQAELSNLSNIVGVL